ncbi:MAG TPA: PIN domain-containing protein [Verrucomicrobiae bacterium]
MTNHIFLDASFWIAYRNERQNCHREAIRILTEMARHRTKFVTTLPVLCEIHAHFSRTPKKKVILQDFENNPLVHIEEVAHADQQLAFKLLRRQTDKSYSLCDAVSFVVMQRLGLKQALAFDDHFRQFGEFEIIS